MNYVAGKGTFAQTEGAMRKLLIGGVLFFLLGGVALAWPYRSEQVIGIVQRNNTGCTIRVDAKTGWQTGGAAVLHVERLTEPVAAGVAAYECDGVIGRRPATMTLLVPGTGERREACASSSSRNWCYAELPSVPRLGDPPQRYILLIQVLPGEPVQAMELTVSRGITWRSGSFDALMSV